MNRSEVVRAVTAAKNLPVMEAWLKGHVVQYCSQMIFTEWKDFTGDSPDFGDFLTEWRVKPIPRRWSVAIDSNGRPRFIGTHEKVTEGTEVIEVEEVVR